MDIITSDRLTALLAPLFRHLNGIATVFRRERVWGELQAIIGLLLWMRPLGKSSQSSACEDFHALGKERFKLGEAPPDPAGLSRAISKLDRTALDDLQHRLATEARSHTRMMPKWLERLSVPVLAVDGTTFSTARTPALRRHFPLITDHSGQALSPNPMTRLVVAWDVHCHCPVTWWLSSIRCGERLSLRTMLHKVSEPSLFLLDRGFPARDLFAELIARQHWFVCRMVTGHGAAWPEVAAFLASGKRSAWVDITIGRGRDRRTMRMRLVRRCFHRGRPRRHQKKRELMVLLTNVPADRLDDRSVVRLYRRRWGIETAFREIKCFNATSDRWRSDDRHGIELELSAVMIWYTLAALITGPLTNGQGYEADERGLRANICVVLRAAFLLLHVLTNPRTRRRLIDALAHRLRWVLRRRCRRRPGRTAPRTKLARIKGYMHS